MPLACGEVVVEQGGGGRDATSAAGGGGLGEDQCLPCLAATCNCVELKEKAAYRCYGDLPPEGQSECLQTGSVFSDEHGTYSCWYCG